MSITVYTKPDCVQCDGTIRALDKAGLSYRTIDLTTDHAARDYVMNTLGYSAAPIVEVDGDDHWSGFRPDRLKSLAAARSPERTQFLVDVLTTAIEGGIGYWAEVTHFEDQTGTEPEGEYLGPFQHADCYAATVRDYETGDEHSISLDTIARGANLLAATSIDNDFRDANRTNGDRGDIDATNADMALQTGIFGDVIYG